MTKITFSQVYHHIFAVFLGYCKTVILKTFINFVYLFFDKNAKSNLISP